MNPKHPLAEEKEKIRLRIKCITQDHKEDYIKHKKNNLRWLERKKITRKAHYERNKEFIKIQRKLGRLIGVAPVLADIKNDKDKFSQMINRLEKEKNEQNSKRIS